MTTLPQLSVANASTLEGTGGLPSLLFEVTLSAASGRTVTVAYATQDRTAIAPGDYAATGGVATFPPATTSLTAPVAGQVPAQSGTTAPWSGQIGGGTQDEFAQPIGTLVQQGYLRRVR